MPAIDGRCSVDLTVEVVGGKWKPLILLHVLEGPRRFGELRRRLTKVSPRMLSLQLRELERDGLVIRTEWPGRVLHVEYAATPLAASLRPVLDAMAEWGLAYHAHRDRERPTS